MKSPRRSSTDLSEPTDIAEADLSAANDDSYDGYPPDDDGGDFEEPGGPSRGRRTRLWVIAAVAVLVAGAAAWWVATSGGQRALRGDAVALFTPAPNAPATTAPGSAAPPAAAPAVPVNLTASLTKGTVVLAWAPAPGTADGTQYVVYRDGVKLATVDAGTGYTDHAAAAGKKYGYQVQAVATGGAASALSQPVSVTVPGSGGPSSSAAAPPPGAPSLPMASSWPSAANTGASGALTDVHGNVTLSTNGQVYANMRVHGTINVTACNVTLRNVEVDAGEPLSGNNTDDMFGIWLQESASCGATVDRVSVITTDAPNNYLTTGIRIARGGPVTITNSKIIGPQLGILGVSPGLLRGNYILLGQNMRGDHNDAVQGDGSANLTIDHNTLLNPNDQTSALALFTEYGANSNVNVTNNLLAGGGFTCYCGDGKSDNDGNPARATHVNFINNVFWRKYFPDAGNFGAGRAYNPAAAGCGPTTCT